MDRSKLYGMIVSQLLDDGLPGAAHAVAAATMLETEQTDQPHCLAKMVASGGVNPSIPGPPPTNPDTAAGSSGDVSLDTKFITTHKNACRVAAFSQDGSYVATGSEDSSLKLLDVSKMKNAQQIPNPSDDAVRPVTRTFYDHVNGVNALAFHPTKPLLASGGADRTVRFFDTNKVASRRARTNVVVFATHALQAPWPTVVQVMNLQDTHAVNSLAFHRAGDFLLVGTDHEAPHLYHTSKQMSFCYIPPDTTSFHTSGISSVDWSSDGSTYVSAGLDGSIRLWDGESSVATMVLPEAHEGAAVHSVVFSKDGRQLLTCGADSMARVWDLNSQQQVAEFAGAAHRAHPCNSCWGTNEQLVFSHDEATLSIVAWDVRSHQMVARRKTEHKNVVRCVAASSIDNCLVTCSDDFRARFWVY